MILTKTKTQVQRNFTNYLGFRTNRKLIILESDDWGSIRMPSSVTRKVLISKNVVSSNDPYGRFDCLECNDDLQELMTTLSLFKDYNGRPPILTMNYIMANPDFQMIRESEFTEYYYEEFYKTYEKLPKRNLVLDFVKEGIENGIFEVELHGREHVNVERWLKHLAGNNKNAKLAFDFDCFFFKTESKISFGKSIFAALDYDLRWNKDFYQNFLFDAKNIFIDVFKRNPTSFIAPNYVWSPSDEDILEELDFRILQGTKFQNSPMPSINGYKRKYRYTGKQTKGILRHTVRNCFFEPSSNMDKTNIVDVTLRQIQNAFFWNTPAIISTHRLNYSGFLEKENRECNLRLLETLLKKILKNWPDVEFMSSTDMATLLNGK